MFRILLRISPPPPKKWGHPGLPPAFLATPQEIPGVSPFFDRSIVRLFYRSPGKDSKINREAEEVVVVPPDFPRISPPEEVVVVPDFPPDSPQKWGHPGLAGV